MENVMNAPQEVRGRGHPQALWYLAFSEAWERFSFYGMQTLLVLYMANHLLLDDRQERIVGLDRSRRGLHDLHPREWTGCRVQRHAQIAQLSESAGSPLHSFSSEGPTHQDYTHFLFPVTHF